VSEANHYLNRLLDKPGDIIIGLEWRYWIFAIAKNRASFESPWWGRI